MIPQQLIDAMRDQTQATFRDSVEIVSVSYTIDDENNRVPGPEVAVQALGNLQHMSMAENRAVAEKIENAVGYKLYLGWDVDDADVSFVRVNGDRYEFLGSMREGAQATYTKFMLARITPEA